MSKSATLPAEPFDDPQQTLGTPAWKAEVNQRLAAHRTRRTVAQDAADQRSAESPRAASARAAEAAARVAARYAKAPSYSELLAGEARAVVRAAGAAAEAARNAQAAAQAVLFGLESGAAGRWEPEPAAQVAPPVQHVAPSRWQDEPPVAESRPAAPEPSPWAGAQPRWEEALPQHSAADDVWSEMRIDPNPAPARGYQPEEVRSQSYRDNGLRRQESDEGDLFPFDPMESATVEPVQHLPANLIEFPRELVATRKARPRLAEGPFYNPAQESPQLNIFEVDPAVLEASAHPSAQIAAQIAGPLHGMVAPPEWASIELDHHPEEAYAENHAIAEAYALAPVVDVPPMDEAAEIDTAFGVSHEVEAPVRAAEVRRKPVAAPQVAAAPAVELLVAPLGDRLLATVVDGALVTLAFLAAAVVVIASTAHPPAGKIALIASGCGLALFGLLYQYLFLSYAEEGTLGMRYARIALCTFDDENPTVEQMRMRIPAMVCAALPAGLGLVWALFDGDKLAWHDRLTKTYQRKY